MDRAGYTSIIKGLLHEYAAIKPSYGDVEVEIIENDATGHYELRYIGWNGARRIHECVLHVDIKGDKIWIQHDGLGDGITPELLDAGIPPSQIVLAWHTEKERQMMGTFAVN